MAIALALAVRKFNRNALLCYNEAMAGPKAVFQPIAIIVAIYAVLLTAGIRLHWAAGPPFYDATFGLLIALRWSRPSSA